MESQHEGPPGGLKSQLAAQIGVSLIALCASLFGVMSPECCSDQKHWTVPRLIGIAVECWLMHKETDKENEVRRRSSESLEAPDPDERSPAIARPTHRKDHRD